jgi:hypothetical protein
MDPIVYVRQYLTMQEFLILAALLGLIPAAIAKSKGRPFLLWWIFGFLALIIALPCALMMKRDVRNLEHRQMREGLKKCPHCAEMIKGDAKVCRFCQREVLVSRQPAASRVPLRPRRKFVLYKRQAT